MTVLNKIISGSSKKASKKLDPLLVAAYRGNSAPVSEICETLRPLPQELLSKALLYATATIKLKDEKLAERIKIVEVLVSAGADIRYRASKLKNNNICQHAGALFKNMDIALRKAADSLDVKEYMRLLQPACRLNRCFKEGPQIDLHALFDYTVENMNSKKPKRAGRRLTKKKVIDSYRKVWAHFATKIVALYPEIGEYESVTSFVNSRVGGKKCIYLTQPDRYTDNLVTTVSDCVKGLAGDVTVTLIGPGVYGPKQSSPEFKDVYAGLRSASGPRVKFTLNVVDKYPEVFECIIK